MQPPTSSCVIAYAQYDERMSTWWEYVVRVSGTDVQKDMAAGSGISESAFSRWKKGTNVVDAGNVVAFARAHHRAPVEALVAAGYLTETEAAEAIEIERGLKARTDDELLAEIRLRMKGARRGVEGETQSSTSAETVEDQEADLLDQREPGTGWGGFTPPARDRSKDAQ